MSENSPMDDSLLLSDCSSQNFSLVVIPTRYGGSTHLKKIPAALRLRQMDTGVREFEDRNAYGGLISLQEENTKIARWLVVLHVLSLSSLRGGWCGRRSAGQGGAEVAVS